MLQFSVQYAVEVPELSRQKLRAWALQAIKAAHEEVEFEFAELTCRFVDKPEAIELNKTYRQKDYAPNVLTFEYGLDELQTVRGDIIICVPILRTEAHEQHKTFEQHAAHLLVHGVLHSLGYDHIEEEEAQHMEALETHILKKIGFPNPYQDRES
ncbi:rRNA maturation RNase YbeY [Pelistega europaea]|uniref:Endoribonuclease YbeY n=1 Tax=Pelistega europaea TaxID=106147 RepID=A0A7Y4P529_9BURK|nr:rRNA maturation RNase YbeY [Pelistega europaea]NOL49348.1 rRNA maturation RNase YbeY [Pelistega europaea]